MREGGGLWQLSGCLRRSQALMSHDLLTECPRAAEHAYPAWCCCQDYLFTYKTGIEAVTADDVLGAAQRHLHPAQQTVVVAADASEVQQSFEERGRRVIPTALD